MVRKFTQRTTLHWLSRLWIFFFYFIFFFIFILFSCLLRWFQNLILPLLGIFFKLSICLPVTVQCSIISLRLPIVRLTPWILQWPFLLASFISASTQCNSFVSFSLLVCVAELFLFYFFRSLFDLFHVPSN